MIDCAYSSLHLVSRDDAVGSFLAVMTSVDPVQLAQQAVFEVDSAEVAHIPSEAFTALEELPEMTSASSPLPGTVDDDPPAQEQHAKPTPCETPKDDGAVITPEDASRCFHSPSLLPVHICCPGQTALAGSKSGQQPTLVY